ncbi:WD40 repeat-like protein, partial [Basidiobolus meristosporus CBS 931.73]
MPNTPAADNDSGSSVKNSSNQPKEPAANSQATNPSSASNDGPSSNQSNPLDIDQFIMDEDFSSFFGNVDGENLTLGEDMDVDSFGNMDFFSNMGFVGNTDSQVEAQSNGQVLQLHAQLTGHNNKVSTCAISSNSDWLASAGHDKKVIIWSLPDKSLAHTLDGHTQQITNARFSPDDRQLLATSSYDKTVRIWNVGASNKAECVTIFTGHTRSVTAVDFCPIAGSDSCCSVDAEGELKVWNIFTGVCEKTVRLSSASKYSGYSSNPVRYNPQVGTKATAAISNTLIYFDVSACEDNSSASDHISTRTFSTQHTKNIFTVDWSLDGAFLLTG